MGVFMDWKLLLPLLGTTVGAGAVLGVPRGSRLWNAALMGAAAGAMLAASLWNLLLPALELSRWGALGGFVLGMVLLLLPQQLPNSGLSPAGALLLAVVLHNIPEGLAVGAGDSPGLTVGIALQNIPDGAVAALPLLALGVSRRRAFFWGVLTGAVEPVAAMAMLLMPALFAPAMPWLLGFAGGAMVSVILLELAPGLGESPLGICTFAAAFVLMAI